MEPLTSGRRASGDRTGSAARCSAHANESSAAPLLEVRDLRVSFDDGGRVIEAVRGVSYRLHAGRSLAIVGESGSGKSLCVASLLGLLPATASVSGSIELDGRELLGLDERQLRRHRGADIAIVFQDADRALNPLRRVGSQLQEAIRRTQRLDRREVRRRACELVESVGLASATTEIADAYPHELSGGMRHRVVLALALATAPRLLVADESTRALDAATQAEIIALLRRLQHERAMALILVSHDLALVGQCADEVLVMRAGEPVELRSARGLLCRPRRAYTRALVRAARDGWRPREPAAPTPDGAPVLEAESVVCAHAASAHRRSGEPMRGASFKLGRGETLGVVGESGSGKSTLAQALLQAPPPLSGAVRLEGCDLTRLRGQRLRERRSRMQMVFQDPLGSLDPTWSVGEIIEEPLCCVGKQSRAERQRRAHAMLERVGLPPAQYAHRRPGELSGGQCQRVAIARAVISRPAVVILDEATSSLDPLIKLQVLELLRELRDELGLAYLFISHDVALVERFSDRVAVMRAGRLCDGMPAELPPPCSKARGKGQMP